VVERLQDLIEKSFEPGRVFRQRARLPAANGHVVFAARQPASPQAAALPSDRPGCVSPYGVLVSARGRSHCRLSGPRSQRLAVNLWRVV
jgi:hypothetical protein